MIFTVTLPYMICLIEDTFSRRPASARHSGMTEIERNRVPTRAANEDALSNDDRCYVDTRW
jgi:hypothetical protein